MTAADFNRFLVICSLVPYLYCPGYSSAETLSKEANLMRTALRYRVDAAKITARITAELPTKRKTGKVQRSKSIGVRREREKRAD
jgi:hypothetical protein